MVIDVQWVINMDANTGLSLMFKGSGSGGSAKKVVFNAPKDVYYYDTEDNAKEVLGETGTGGHIIHEVYSDGSGKLYQLIIDNIDTADECITGIKDLNTGEIITIEGV